jgi:hypothetical protein
MVAIAGHAALCRPHLLSWRRLLDLEAERQCQIDRRARGARGLELSRVDEDGPDEARCRMVVGSHPLQTIADVELIGAGRW